MTSDDEDYYKISLPADGYVSLNFSHVEQESGYNSWDVELYDANKTYIDGIDCYGNKESTVSNNIGLSAGDYYVYVYSEHSYSNIDYQVKLIYTVDANWETEFNNGYTTADTMTFPGKKMGNVMSSRDEDYYRFSVPKTTYVDISLTHGLISETYNLWSFEVYDSNRNLVASQELAGTKTTGQFVKKLYPGDYYIRVAYGNSWSDIDYTLSVKYYVPKVAIKSVASKAKKKMIVKWKKASGVSGYEIVTARDKKFKKSKKVTKIGKGKTVSKTITKLKSKKTYYVKVRAYKIINGKKYYGAYSKVKKIKIR